jgi:hypothetical protein
MVKKKQRWMASRHLGRTWPPNNSLVPTFPQAFEGVDAQGRVCTLSDEQAMRLVADVDQIVVNTGNQSSAQPLLGLEQVRSRP